MANTKDRLQYADYRLAWNINEKYHDIVNCEIVKPPYSKRLWNSSFFLDKRKWFRRAFLNQCAECLNPPEAGNPFYDIYPDRNNWGGGEFTDIINIDWKNYYMWVNNSHTIMRIYTIDDVINITGTWTTSCCFYQVWGDHCINEDSYTKFIPINYVKWEPRFINDLGDLESSTGIQVNEGTPVDAKFRDAAIDGILPTSFLNTFGRPQVGDYLFAYGLSIANVTIWPNEAAGIPWQVGVITGVSWAEIDIRDPWVWFAPGQELGTGIKYRIYPEWGEVFAIDTCDGIKVWTFDPGHLNPGPYGGIDPFVPAGINSESSKFVGVNSWRINYLTEDGYLNYGGTGQQIFYRTSADTVFVGTDVIAAPTFQQYTLLFTEDKLKVVRYTINDDGSVTYDLNNTDLNIGLYNKYSFDLYRSSFYFLGSNKRLYALTISPTTYGTFQTQLEDMSALIKWELDNILDWDDVRIQSSEQDMKIFINSDYRGNGVYNKTKILIFDKDYQFWHKWEVCWGKINGQYKDQYVGDSVYHLCWDTDFYDCELEQWIPFEQRIQVILGENELGENNFNMWQAKKLLDPKFIVWHNTNMTNGNSYIDIDMITNCYKPKYRIGNPERICYIKLLNDIKSWALVKPTAEAISLLNRCNNYTNPCEWSWDSYTNLVPSDRCGCPDERPKFADYCVCIDDNKYFLAPYSKVTWQMPLYVEAETFIITLVAPGSDNIEYGGMMIPHYLKWAEDKNKLCENDWRCECEENEGCYCSDNEDPDCGCE